jgi:hypothetical protein
VILEIGFAALLAKAFFGKNRKGQVTPEREAAYLEALESCRGPEGIKVLRKTAGIYARYGLSVHAKMLRKRADFLEGVDTAGLGRTPEQVKAFRKEMLERARKSFNADGIEAVAAQFENLTATGYAKELHERARAIRAGEITAPPPERVEVTATPVSGETPVAPTAQPVVTPPPVPAGVSTAAPDPQWHKTRVMGSGVGNADTKDAKGKRKGKKGERAAAAPVTPEATPAAEGAE